MRRIAIVGALVGVGILIMRTRAPKLRDRVMARCEGMFERMPDTFPPKRAMRSIEEIRVDATRIRELLEARQDEADEAEAPASSAGGTDVGAERVGAPQSR